MSTSPTAGAKSPIKEESEVSDNVVKLPNWCGGGTYPRSTNFEGKCDPKTIGGCWLNPKPGQRRHYGVRVK